MKTVLLVIVIAVALFFLRGLAEVAIGWIILGAIALAAIGALIIKSGSYNVYSVGNKGDTNVNFHFHGAHNGRGTVVRDDRTQRRMKKFDQGGQTDGAENP